MCQTCSLGFKRLITLFLQTLALGLSGKRNAYYSLTRGSVYFFSVQFYSLWHFMISTIYCTWKLWQICMKSTAQCYTVVFHKLNWLSVCFCPQHKLIAYLWAFESHWTICSATQTNYTCIDCTFQRLTTGYFQRKASAMNISLPGKEAS